LPPGPCEAAPGGCAGGNGKPTAIFDVAEHRYNDNGSGIVNGKRQWWFKRRERRRAHM